jgi:hypothetical protein
MLFLSKGFLRKALYWSDPSSFQRNGPAAASPCKGMGQWQLTSPAKGEFASEKMFSFMADQPAAVPGLLALCTSQVAS